MIESKPMKLAILVFWIAIALQTIAHSNERPNIILVMADDQGWGQTSYNGHPVLKTPNLDAMAANGLCFNRFYAAAPVCSPTRASVLTGRTNMRTGVASHGFALRKQEKTLASALKAAGYATGHFGKWHLNGMRGPGVPILKDDPYRPSQFGFETWLTVSNFFDLNPILSRNGAFEEFQGDSSEVIVAEALKFIGKNASADKPSFTVIWYGTPHGPFRASEPDKRPFADLKPRTRDQLGELVAMDRSIGSLRKGLRDLNISDNTIVWFTSDNGGLPNMEPGTTGKLRGYKASLYEGGLRVPTIIEWPEKIPPRVTNYPSVSMDIFPTLAEIVGLPVSTMLQPQDGLSLTRIFRGELLQRDKPIPFQCFGMRALIDNDTKLLWVGKRNGTERHFELYDLKSDPGEQNDLMKSQPELASEMQRKMEKVTASINRSIEGRDYPEGKVDPSTPEPRSWMNVPVYRPYFDAWKKRPEYRSWLKEK